MRTFIVFSFFFLFFFVSCSEDLAQRQQVKPMENQEQKIGMGLIPMSQSEITSVALAIKPLRGNLPISYDLSPYFPPVGSQGGQGSCAAWSSGYNYKSFLENFERNWGFSTYDHIMSPAFVYNYAHRGESEYYCNNAGMTLKQAADILKNVGIVPWSEMPYDERVCSVGPTQEMIRDAYKYRIDDYKRVEFEDFKTFLASNMPIFFGAEIFENFTSCWKYSDCMSEYRRNGNVFKRLSGRSEGGHGMVLVGYDDRKQAFKLINSWGTYWGEDGYLWVSYSTLRTMMRNFGTFGYVFIDHIEDPCEGIDCSGHGECKVSAQRRPYCECDEGYTSDLLNCVKCESHSYKRCINGNILWYDTCSNMEDIYKTCDNGCQNIGESDAECIASECESHATQKCYENDIYWYDSCGNREGKALDCGDNTCNDLGNGNVECKATNPCDGVNCPSNSSCKISSNNEAACYCNEGYHVNEDYTACVQDDDNSQNDVCNNVNCPDNSHCEVNNNNQAGCYCNEGYHVNEDYTACVQDNDNSQNDLCVNVNCPDNSTCRIYNNEAACYCNEGFKVENGRCVEDVPDVCRGINCEQWYANTVCIEYNGQAGCDCKDGYHWSGNNCVR